MGRSSCGTVLSSSFIHAFAQINDNKISTLEDLGSQLKPISSLETVYLEGNPVQKTEGVHYRRKVILALPQIKQLDAT